MHSLVKKQHCAIADVRSAEMRSGLLDRQADSSAYVSGLLSKTYVIAGADTIAQRPYTCVLLLQQGTSSWTRQEQRDAPHEMEAIDVLMQHSIRLPLTHTMQQEHDVNNLTLQTCLATLPMLQKC